MIWSVSCQCECWPDLHGSGVDSVIITGSLLGGATIRLDNSGSSEEAADSITVGTISSGVIYGESGADTFNISSNAIKASIYGGGQNDYVTVGGSLSSALLEGADGADSFILANVTSSTIQGGADADRVSASGLVSAGVLYGNSGNDSIEVVGAMSRAQVFMAVLATTL